MGRVPAFRATPQQTAGGHVDALMELLGALKKEGDEGSSLDSPLSNAWASDTLRIGIVSILGRALRNAGLVSYRNGLLSAGKYVDDLVGRLEAAEEKAESSRRRRSSAPLISAAIASWERDMMSKERLSEPVVKVLKEAGLQAHQHFKKPS